MFEKTEKNLLHLITLFKTADFNSKRCPINGEVALKFLSVYREEILEFLEDKYERIIDIQKAEAAADKMMESFDD